MCREPAMDTAQNLDYLVAVLKDQLAHPRARSKAIEALAAFKTQAVAPLISVLRDQNPEIRAKSAEVLGTIGDSCAFDPLMVALNDENPSVQVSAIIALGRIGDSRAIPVLIDLLSWLPGNSYEVQAVEKALAMFGEAAVESCVDAFLKSNQKIRNGVSGALRLLRHENSIDPLLGALEHSDHYVRADSAYVLSVFSDERVINALADTLHNDPESFVRDSAAESLGNIGAPKAVEHLIQHLSRVIANGGDGDNVSVKRLEASFDPKTAKRLANSFERARREASARSISRALGEIGDLRAVEPLIQALQRADRTTWRYYAEALGKIGDPRAIKPLAQALLSADIEIRRHASRLLGERFGEAAVPYLVRVLSHENYTARFLAAEALTKIDSLEARVALERSRNGKEILEPVKDTVIIIKAPKRKWWEFWKL